MVIKKIRKHGQNSNITYTGELGDTKVNVVFENEVLPTEGDLDVISGKLVTKGDLNYYYIKGYRLIRSGKDCIC